MKKGIHPAWYPEAKVSCSCGNSFTLGSTSEEIHVEICSKCHPFYTGEMKFIDTAGRVERFKNKQQSVDPSKVLKKRERLLLKRQEEERKEAERPKSLKEMFAKKTEH